MNLLLDSKKNYVPILKAKQGEIIALHESESTVLDRMIPLLEIPNLPWDYETDTPKKTAEKHINETLKSIVRHFPNRPFYLDFCPDLLNQGEVKGDPWKLIAPEIYDELMIIPTTTLNRSDDYLQGVANIAGMKKLGSAIRVNFDLSDEDPVEPTTQDYDRVLKIIGIKPSEADVILDLGSVYEDQINTVYWAARLLISETPRIGEWRNFILSMSSFPESLAPIKKDSMDKLERTEWLAWKLLNDNQTKLKRMPIFSDYSIAHPASLELDPRMMNVTAGIRYTVENAWLIIRGKAIKQKEGYKYDQFRELCANLIGTRDYLGAEYSSGDKFISECATNPESSIGNLGTWRKVGNNHHFKVVVELLANLV